MRRGLSLTQGTVMSSTATAATLTCAHCAIEFPQPTVRRGKVQRYCSRPCQITAANMRRASTRAGRINSITYPHAGEPSGRPLPSTLTDIPPSVDRSATDAPDSRLAELMAKAHSRGGVTAWEIAEIAKLRGISAWAPLSVIIAKDTTK
jgi:hypothetical protein